MPTAVVMLNDEITFADVVIDILARVFGHPEPVAHELMMEIHESGEGVVAVRPSSEAEKLLADAIHFARLAGTPLAFELRDAAPDETEPDANPR